MQCLRVEVEALSGFGRAVSDPKEVLSRTLFSGRRFLLLLLLQGLRELLRNYCGGKHVVSALLTRHGQETVHDEVGECAFALAGAAHDCEDLDFLVFGDFLEKLQVFVVHFQNELAAVAGIGRALFDGN